MKISSLATLTGTFLLIAGSAFAAVSLTAEISNARTHANNAANAPTIDAVHTHMHHALNCLVGPKGEGFDAAQMNPCTNAGNGAIPDQTDTAKKAKLEDAKTILMKGLTETDVKAAQRSAETAVAAIAAAM
ncbi:MAG: hypothetical protein J0I19_02725 [Alphaproteobacteria bacterium]|nr:hypothetical protein [Alphaproteobacteria bacterium]